MIQLMLQPLYSHIIRKILKTPLISTLMTCFLPLCSSGWLPFHILIMCLGPLCHDINKYGAITEEMLPGCPHNMLRWLSQGCPIYLYNILYFNTINVYIMNILGLLTMACPKTQNTKTRVWKLQQQWTL